MSGEMLRLRKWLLAILIGMLFVPEIHAQCLRMGEHECIPPLHFSCAFGLIDWSISSWRFEEQGGDSLAVTASPGPLPVLLGSVDCDALTFSVTATVPGSCTETYTLFGVITSETEWSGVFEALFSGDCMDCVDQLWLVGPDELTSVQQDDGAISWGTIKVLYRVLR